MVNQWAALPLLISSFTVTSEKTVEASKLILGKLKILKGFSGAAAASGRNSENANTGGGGLGKLFVAVLMFFWWFLIKRLVIEVKLRQFLSLSSSFKGMKKNKDRFDSFIPKSKRQFCHNPFILRCTLVDIPVYLWIDRWISRCTHPPDLLTTRSVAV